MFFMKVSERRCRILALMLLIVILTLSFTMSPALADSDKRVVKVMTQNMDAGTDLFTNRAELCVPLDRLRSR
jgi:hypothetical protein